AQRRLDSGALQAGETQQDRIRARLLIPLGYNGGDWKVQRVGDGPHGLQRFRQLLTTNLDAGRRLGEPGDAHERAEDIAAGDDPHDVLRGDDWNTIDFVFQEQSRRFFQRIVRRAGDYGA